MQHGGLIVLICRRTAHLTCKISPLHFIALQMSGWEAITLLLRTSLPIKHSYLSHKRCRWDADSAINPYIFTQLAGLATFSNNNYTTLGTFYKVLLFSVFDLKQENSKSTVFFMFYFRSLLNNTDRQLNRGFSCLVVGFVKWYLTLRRRTVSPDEKIFFKPYMYCGSCFPIPSGCFQNIYKRQYYY